MLFTGSCEFFGMGDEKTEEEYDFVERAIRNTGCWEQHLACAECMSDTKDWRECQKEVKFILN